MISLDRELSRLCWPLSQRSKQALWPVLQRSWLALPVYILETDQKIYFYFSGECYTQYEFIRNTIKFWPVMIFRFFTTSWCPLLMIFCYNCYHLQKLRYWKWFFCKKVFYHNEFPKKLKKLKLENKISYYTPFICNGKTLNNSSKKCQPILDTYCWTFW